MVSLLLLIYLYSNISSEFSRAHNIHYLTASPVGRFLFRAAKTTTMDCSLDFTEISILIHTGYSRATVIVCLNPRSYLRLFLSGFFRSNYSFATQDRCILKRPIRCNAH